MWQRDVARQLKVWRLIGTLSDNHQRCSEFHTVCMYSRSHLPTLAACRRLRSVVRQREVALRAPALESISLLFHTTTDDDTAIAARLTAQGIPVSVRQVKDARVSQGWRRLNNQEKQQQQQRQQTATA